MLAVSKLLYVISILKCTTAFIIIQRGTCIQQPVIKLRSDVITQKYYTRINDIRYIYI